MGVGQKRRRKDFVNAAQVMDLISFFFEEKEKPEDEFRQQSEVKNAILKDYKYNTSLEMMLDIFEENLAQLGSQIIIQRKKYLEALQKQAAAIYTGIASGKEKLEIDYHCSFKTENEETLKEEFLAALKNSRSEDMQTLSTSVGPHRDDIEIMIDGISARKFGSQGQQRSAVLALKLGEANVNCFRYTSKFEH